MPRTSGFTLIELLVAVAICTLLACIALPAWSSVSAASHSTEAKARILDGLLASIRRASVTGSEAVLCPATPDGAGCAATADWTNGWIGFVDGNGNRQRDAGESLYTSAGRLVGSARMRSTDGRRRIVFQPHGGNAGSNVTLTLCDARGPTRAITLVLSNPGRLREVKPSVDAAWRCMGR